MCQCHFCLSFFLSELSLNIAYSPYVSLRSNSKVAIYICKGSMNDVDRSKTSGIKKEKKEGKKKEIKGIKESSAERRRESHLNFVARQTRTERESRRKTFLRQHSDCTLHVTNPTLQICSA